MGYMVRRPKENREGLYYLVQRDHMSARWSELPERASLFNYDDMIDAVLSLPGADAVFVPQSEGEREFDKGTAWLTPDGTIYRLRDYGPDFEADDPFLAAEVPSYDVSRPSGGHSTTYALPANARLIWHPRGK